MIDLQKQDNVFVLRMKNGENRLNSKFVAAFNAALDEAEHASETGALVTIGEGKYWSNGLDLDWMATVPEAEARESIRLVTQLLARLVELPLITVAAFNGHAFAAGAMLGLAHDFRVMRGDRGYFCLPEADIKIPFSPGMTALIQAKLAIPVAHEAMVTAKRYTAQEAERCRIVERVVDEAGVLSAALEIAKANANKHKPTLGAIKRLAYADATAKLRA